MHIQIIFKNKITCCGEKKRGKTGKKYTTAKSRD
jgi:hypothetical protein